MDGRKEGRQEVGEVEVRKKTGIKTSNKQVDNDRVSDILNVLFMDETEECFLHRFLYCCYSCCS